MNSEYRKKIQRVYSRLTRSQRKVAEFIIDNPSKITLMSADQLAKASGVGEATVIRFARILGYKGYSDMKEEFQRALIDNLTSSKKVEEGLKSVSSETVLDELLKTHMAVFQNMNVAELTKSLKNAARIIFEANDVYVFGEGAALVPAMELSFWLNRFGKKTWLFGTTGRSFFEHVVNIRKNDVSIGFAYRKINFELRILFSETRKRGGKNILFTDQALNQLCDLADEIIVTDRGGIGSYRSMAIPVIMSDALLFEFAAINETSLENLRNLEKIRREYGYE
ncbi:MAG: MurR/RpiR family transcriptional regulator [Pseudothermotoga sp.]|uniref:MurR/RpiR family transcriptional regulator n=1 Tax=Pseudothermotoga sp. TaxID=2033661 RepID=UPI0025831E6E|nr:MurR/RpiR family transcriptional regulator [Pseudothermotoga sp.]MDI6861989.1 MurR/RpiR family transcriptional regulator [Pseudothermotoga sp.]